MGEPFGSGTTHGETLGSTKTYRFWNVLRRSWMIFGKTLGSGTILGEPRDFEMIFEEPFDFSTIETL
jgi:hypothetical protein